MELSLNILNSSLYLPPRSLVSVSPCLSRAVFHFKFSLNTRYGIFFFFFPRPIKKSKTKSFGKGKCKSSLVLPLKQKEEWCGLRFFFLSFFFPRTLKDQSALSDGQDSNPLFVTLTTRMATDLINTGTSPLCGGSSVRITMLATQTLARAVGCLFGLCLSPSTVWCKSVMVGLLEVFAQWRGLSMLTKVTQCFSAQSQSVVWCNNNVCCFPLPPSSLSIFICLALSFSDFLSLSLLSSLPPSLCDYFSVSPSLNLLSLPFSLNI